MKSISVMEAQRNLSKWIQEVEAGQEFAITRRRKVVARLSPPVAAKPLAFPNFKARAKLIWGRPWTGGGSEELLDESRGER